MINILRDPVREAERIEEVVVRSNRGSVLRAYFTIGLHESYAENAVLAGMMGCNLSCVYCMWPSSYINPRKIGREKYLSPSEAASRILSVAEDHGLGEVRLSGGEPTLGWEHTKELIRLLRDRRLRVVLETNGILPAIREDIVSDIAGYTEIMVRVSIKAATPEIFETLTRTPARYHDYPFIFIERLVEAGVDPGRIVPVIMISFEDPRVISGLGERLASIDERLVRNAEPEILVVYPHILKRFKRLGRRLRPSPFKYPWEEEPL